MAALQKLGEAGFLCKSKNEGNPHQTTLRCGFPQLMVLHFLSTPLELELLEASDYVECFRCGFFLLSNAKVYAKDKI